MSKKRGLSVEEKRTRMMELFYEKLKELEKLCQKEKGITSMSVKEILTSLVDDNMVDTDKIGTCVYFWAFPSKASQNRKRKLEDLQQRLDELERKRQATAEKIKNARVGREDTESRTGLLQALVQREEEMQRLDQEIQRHRDCDPEVMQLMKQEADVAREAVERWTDNIFSVKSWIKKKFPIEESTLDKQFGIPEEFDYL